MSFIDCQMYFVIQLLNFGLSMAGTPPSRSKGEDAEDEGHPRDTNKMADTEKLYTILQAFPCTPLWKHKEKVTPSSPPPCHMESLDPNHVITPTEEQINPF